MHKIIRFFVIFFFLITFFILGKEHVYAANTNVGNKCITCGPLTGKWANYNFVGKPIDRDPPYGINLTGDIKSTCTDDRSVDCLDKPYCIYDSVQGAPDGANRIYHIWSNPTKSQNACTAPMDLCLDDKGCVGSDRPDETQCSKKETLCTSQSDCKNGTDNQCSNYYCVNINTNELLSDKDLTIDLNNLKCRYFDADNAPECPENSSCDNPFGVPTCQSNKDCEDPTPFCAPDKNGVLGCRSLDGEWLPLACTRDDAESKDFKCRTALGIVNTSPEDFIKRILGFVLGISGGILIILFIFNGYKFMVSQGDPEKIKDAREGIIAAISGLLLIIFSLFLLSLITVNLLDLPGFR